MSQGIAFIVQAAAFAVFAVLSACAMEMLGEPKSYALGPCFCLCIMWVGLTVRIISAHGFRVLVRSWGTDAVSLREGSILLCFPDYIVRDKAQFGPWCRRDVLPTVGQSLAIDVPEVLVPVDNGVYCLKVNTKIMGVVENYSVADLLQNPVSIEDRSHDVIAHALRCAVYDKSLAEALTEIQRIFLKDATSISALLSVPAFRPTQLLLDANERIAPADAATTEAMAVLVRCRSEAAKRTALEASMETEEQKVKLHRISLQTTRNEFMLQQEAYGKEGAALIEAAKHAKALYLFSGGSGISASTVLTLPG